MVIVLSLGVFSFSKSSSEKTTNFPFSYSYALTISFCSTVLPSHSSQVLRYLTFDMVFLSNSLKSTPFDLTATCSETGI